METVQPAPDVDRTSRLLRLLMKVVFAVVAAVLAFVGVASLGRGGLGALGATFSLIVAIALLVGLYFLIGRVDAFHLHPVLISVAVFVLAFVPRLIVALSYRAQPFNDFQTYYMGGFHLYTGQKWILTDPYFVRYPDNIGFIWMQGWLMHIIGTSVLAMQILYVVVTSVTCVVIYLIVRHIDSRAAIIAAVIYALFPANVVWPTVLTNQHVSTLLCLLAFWVVLKALHQPIGRQIALIVLAGVTFGVANLVRPEVPPYVAAVAVILVLRQFTKTARALRPAKRLIGASLVIVLAVSYFAPTWAFYSHLRQYGVTSSSSDLRYKFIVGLDYAGGGGFTDGAAPVIDAYWAADDATRQAMFKSAFTYYLKSPFRLVPFELGKLMSQYSDLDSALVWSMGNAPDYWDGEQPGASSSSDPAVRAAAAQQEAFTLTTAPVYTVMLLLAAYAAWKYRKRLGEELIILLVAGFAVRVFVYAFILNGDRYRYMDMPTFAILAALGLGLLVTDVRTSRLFKDEDDGADPATPLADARSAQDDE